MMLETKAKGPPGTLVDREAIDAARDAIHLLGEKEREVFLMRVSGGLTFDSIADALGIPSGTAKTRMRRAILFLRERLADHAPKGAPIT